MTYIDETADQAGMKEEWNTWVRRGLLGAELPDDVVHKAKMLKRMQVLEEKGIAFATRPLSSLPVIGKLACCDSSTNFSG